jgi:hypothetical protein
MVIANDCEGGYLTLESPFEAITSGLSEWCKSPTADEAKGLDGEVQCLVRGCEHDPIIFLGLQEAPHGLQLLDLGQHAVSGQQYIQGSTLLQHLLNSTDGALQLVEILPQLLHLQIQRLGLHLADLFYLKEKVRGREGDAGLEPSVRKPILRYGGDGHESPGVHMWKKLET